MGEGLNYLQTFNPVESKPDLLEHTLVGRKDLVDRLEELVVESVSGGNKVQRLTIGPRGSGKTHLLKVLQNRVSMREDLADKLEIAYLCEDEYGVATFLDWLIRIFRSFIRWNPEKANYLTQEIEKLKKVPPADQEKIATKILLNHIEGKTLLIIVENIGNIFDENKGFGKKGQQKFRDLVQQHPYFTIIATNQALFEAVQKEDMPFHNFFKIIHLKKLELDEAILFLKTIAGWEGNNALITFLDSPEGKGKLKAIYELVGGNHRLLVTFYNFLKTDYIDDLSKSFLKTINDLIPYYQGMMDLLSAQQQKIIQYLCQIRTASNVKNIAENCFSTHNVISKQMVNLERLKYVDATSSGKETFYELSEPLLRICNEVKENRGGPIKLFVDFLGNLYSVEEIKRRYVGHDYYSYFNLVSREIRLNQPEEALKQLKQALKISCVNKLTAEIIPCFEENHATLFIYSSIDNIITYLNQSLDLIDKYSYTPQFYRSFSSTIFETLKQHDKIETKKFELIEDYLNNKFKGIESMVVPLKYLNIGIRHLKKNEKNVLFQLTKEERLTYKKFVLNKDG